MASILPVAPHPASAPRTGCRRRPLPHPRRGAQKAPNPLILQKGDRLRAGPHLLWVGHNLVHFLHSPLIHSFAQHLESLSGTEAVLGIGHTRMTKTWSAQLPKHSTGSALRTERGQGSGRRLRESRYSTGSALRAERGQGSGRRLREDGNHTSTWHGKGTRAQGVAKGWRQIWGQAQILRFRCLPPASEASLLPKAS